ncbi:MAG: DUF4279 domain-containing protein [Lysobacter sp.]
MHPYTYRVSLRLTHPRADLSELGALLETQPAHSRSRRAGDPRVTPKGTPLQGLHQQSSWATGLTEGPDPRRSQDEDLEAFLEAQLDRLAPHTERLRSLRDDGGSAMFFIGLFCDSNCGLILSPRLMAKAAALGIELGLDIYADPNPSHAPPQTDDTMAAP